MTLVDDVRFLCEVSKRISSPFVREALDRVAAASTARSTAP